jgi:hypothetical protein
MSEEPQRLDLSALKVNQAGIIATVLVATAGSVFFSPFSWLIPLLAIVMIAGSFWPTVAVFKQLYFHVLRPRGMVRPAVVDDSPAPHNFAQAFGGVVLVLATVLLIFLPVLGFALALLVALLAVVNLAFGYCVGCQIYFQLGRRGLVRT